MHKRVILPRHLSGSYGTNIYNMNIIYLLPEEHYIGITTLHSERSRMVNHRHNGRNTEGYQIVMEESDRKTALYYERRIQTELGYKGYSAPSEANLVRTEKKPVNQYKADGTFVRTWPSAREADRGLNMSLGSVGRVCRGDQHLTKGFIFKFS